MTITETTWSGSQITQGGIYKDISLDDYHGNLDLFDGPSVSKSAIKYMAPPNGSAKEFWHRWSHNPDSIKPKKSNALNFGKAVHAILLGDEVFAEKYATRPVMWDSWRSKAAQEWKIDQEANGITVITDEDLEKIHRMHDDAAKHPIVKAGVLNGRAERSMFWQCPDTKIWLRARPDMIPNGTDTFVDLKSVGKMEQSFIDNQVADCGYYLQAGMLKVICEGLGIPFDGFAMVYVSTAETPDTQWAEMSDSDIQRGADVVRMCLKIIRHGLDTGEWQGADICNAGAQPLMMKSWAATRVDDWLIRSEQDVT